MFTGIISEIGIIEYIQRKGKGMIIKIKAPECSKELKVNDSISVNGACLTVISKIKYSFEADIVEETLNKTTLGKFRKGDYVNLELPMRINGRFGGHIVLGHVDCVGKIIFITKRTVSTMIEVEYPKEYVKYVIPAGSIAMDGASLTLAQIKNRSFIVAIIPHTMKSTIIRYKKIGDEVNLEFDILGKYLENMINKTDGQFLKRRLDSDKLKWMGY